MKKMAIMVDGGFFHKRANALQGNDATALERAETLIEYCKLHLKHYREQADLYRIFYYDCPPSNEVVYHPFLKKQIELGKTAQFRWMSEFQKALLTKRKVALRLGRLSDLKQGYSLSNEAVKKLCNGTIAWSDLVEKDFHLDVKQKGVDMKLGVDIASIAYKKQVDQIVLISGDSDFVPAAKAARREGIDFILDPMWQRISDDLQEHIDGVRSHCRHTEPKPQPQKDAASKEECNDKKPSSKIKINPREVIVVKE